MPLRLPAGRPLIYLALLAALGVSLLPLGDTVHPIYFAETGFTVSGRFLDVWLGPHTYQEAVAIDGYPISDVHDETNPSDGQVYRVQWFERARFEAHPDQPPPHDVQLSLLGRDAVGAARRATPPFQPVPAPPGLGPTLAWYPQTGHTIRGAFLQFWNRYGSWQQFGFPLSEEYSEPDPQAGPAYIVQYFERSRFEYHSGSAPAYGGVVLGLLGQAAYHPAATLTPARR